VNNLQLLIICFSAIAGASSIATILMSGWVKAIHISELKAEIKELWAHISKVSILETKLEAIDKNIAEIKDLLNK
jgi:hypothetical protein